MTQPDLDAEEVAEHEWADWPAYVARAERADSDLSPWSRLQVAQLQQWGLVERFLNG